MASELVSVLEATLGHDNTSREAASRWLESAKATDFNGFLTSLAGELANAENQPMVRQAAGLQLKNSLSGQHDNVTDQDVERWGSVSEHVRQLVKHACVTTLGTEMSSPSTAAQVISIIAVIEVPRGLWTDVIEQLLSLLSAEASESLKVAVLEAVGYITEGIAEIDLSLLQKDANVLLTHVIRCLSKDEPSARVQHAAATCLHNSLEFCKANFDSDDERNVIMQVVCEATQLPDTRVKIAALECLVAIVDIYYKYMEAYFAAALFHITLQAMQDENDSVILQGIEFWTTVAEREGELMDDAANYESHFAPPVSSKHYTLGALPHIVPHILKLLARQDEAADEDDWTVAKGASICLGVIASVVGDAILEFGVPFIQEHIQSPSWELRDAAVMTFLAVVQGASTEACTPMVEQALPHLVSLMQDPSDRVRDSVAFLLGEIFDHVPTPALRPENLQPVLEALASGLSQEAHVATNACWAFEKIATKAYEVESELNEERTGDSSVATNVLSPHYEAMVGKLFETVDRQDLVDSSSLKLAVYESLVTVLQSAPEDCYSTLQQAMTVIMQRMQATLAAASRENADLQALLCAVLSTILRKLHSEDLVALAGDIMGVLSGLLEVSYTHASNNVQDEALMTVSAFIEGLGEQAAHVVEALKPHIILGLKNVDDHRVCFNAVTAVGDVFRQLGENALPYADEFMTCLFEDLTNPALDPSVQPHILSTFNDVAMALGLNFQKYFEVCMGILSQATIAASNSPVVNPEEVDFDAVDAINELRSGCLEAYTGAILALRGEADEPNPAVQALIPSVEHMVSFIAKIIQDQYVSDECIRSSCGIIGDLCKIFGAQLAPLIPQQFINALQLLASKSEQKKTRKHGKYVGDSYSKFVLNKSGWA